MAKAPDMTITVELSEYDRELLKELIRVNKEGAKIQLDGFSGKIGGPLTKIETKHVEGWDMGAR